jgi:hypothetical protein
MANANNSMTPIKVQIFLTFVVPDLTALSFDNIHVKKRIYIE